MITNNSASNWASIIKEELGVTDLKKVNWISEYASNHEIFEASNTGGFVQGGAQVGTNMGPGYATPLNTTGMGNPMFPQNPAGPQGFHSPNYQRGSGDIPMSTLPMSLYIAANTIGLELLPVIPMNGPWTMLSYLDFPYAGGKIGSTNQTDLDGRGEGTENKPYYIKVALDQARTLTTIQGANTRAQVMAGETATFTTDGGVFTGIYIKRSRISGDMIFKVVSAVSGGANVSIIDVFDGNLTAFASNAGAIATPIVSVTLNGGAILKADLVATSLDHIEGFTNFATGAAEPMSRAQNETGIGNTIGLRTFTKVVEAKSFEVTATITRQQLQDLPLYGIDAVAQAFKAAQNEISQSLNKLILNRLFRLGVTTAAQEKANKGTDLNLLIAPSTTVSENLSAMGSDILEYRDINGVDYLKGVTYTEQANGSYVVTPTPKTWVVVNSESTGSNADQFASRQRRISSRILAATSLIGNLGRRGRATFAVTNAQVATALADVSGYIIAPMVNTIAQDTDNLYFAGTLAGLQIYVDPNMEWGDTRVLVGRKGDANSPGVVFCPYILADTVTTTPEGTAGHKLLINSRFALVDLGFNPELSYYTFLVKNEYGLI